MPLYEYRCAECNHVFEVFHEVGGTPGPCPVCGGAPKRIFTSVGLIFKGSGFHSTDYRKRGPEKNDGDGAGAPKDSSASKESSAGGGKTKEAAAKTD